MNRSLKLSMLMALALGTSQAMALDLGQIQVKSTLGQPLLAEIPLHPANPAELQNLTVQLASSEDFARAGIQGGRTSIPLHFSVASTGNGQQVIRITSTVVVDDPYLDLLVEVNGKAGKSVREFAILLDPPGTPASALASTQAVTTKTSNSATTTSAPAKATHTPVASAPRENHVAAVPKTTASAPATTNNGNYGPVASGQTLSSIARHTMPAGVDVNQMLLALKQANPDAFYRDNINALKTGAVLRVPTSDEAQAMTVAAAVAAVQRENGDWRAGTTSKPTTVADAATRASSSSAPTGTSSGSADRLALVPAKDVNGAGGQSGSAGGKSAAGLRQDLLRTQESLATLQQQGNDLTARLKDLTDINSKNEHLLSLKDNEIAELQGELAKARKAAGLPPAAVAASGTAPAAATSTPTKPVAAASTEAKSTSTAAASTVASAPTVAPSSTAITATPAAAGSANAASTSAASVAPAAATPAPVKPVIKKHVVRPIAPPVEDQPWYMQTWAWAVGAVVVLLLLVGLMRRRKTAVAPLPKSASSLADRFESASPTEHDGDDVDQNELLDELAEHPDDIHLHLELVTLYYSRRDVEHFEAAAEAMHAHITDPNQDEWQDVVHMGEDLVPGHPLFDQHVVPTAHVETAGTHDFGTDGYVASSDAATTPPPLPPTPRKVSEYNFNFDLSGPVSTDTAADHAADARAAETIHEQPAIPQAEPASAWHFDDNEHQVGGQTNELGEYSDDPIDTKLDLARAYLDMGDGDGARAMLGEVIKEGSQIQQDVAKRLLETLH